MPLLLVIGAKKRREGEILIFGFIIFFFNCRHSIFFITPKVVITVKKWYQE